MLPACRAVRTVVNDGVAIEAVIDIEGFGSNLSRKIWQKITMIEQSARLR
jgi:hypothetical protein